MSQPYDRSAAVKQPGQLDKSLGEFWVENPWDIVRDGHNLSAYERNRVFLNVPAAAGGTAATGTRDFLDVSYLSGAADAIPADDGAFDFAFLSMVIHHVGDLGACARELHRVLEPGGLVFIRNTFAGRLDRVRYFEFFPEARAADETRLPTVESVRAAFAGHGFELVTLDTLEQEIDSSLAAHYDRIKQRALSTFALITDAQFEAGLTRMRQAAESETTPTPVLEGIDLLVLRRPKN